MFTEKIVGLLNELIKNYYEINVKTVKDDDRTMEVYATSTTNKVYKIVIDENGMNKKGEDATVIKHIHTITDRENLEINLKIMNGSDIFISIEDAYLYSDKICLKYKVFEDVGEDDETELGEIIDSGIEELNDSKKLLEIVRTFFEDYEIHMKIDNEIGA